MYFSSQFESCKSDIKKTWSLINNILNRSNKPSLSDHFFDDRGNRISDSNSIANSFNNFFSKIGQSLSDKIPRTDKHFSEYISRFHSNEKFTFREATDIEVLKAINKLKNKKSTGFDNFSTKLIKSIKSTIVPIITKIFNQSVNCERFPSKLKIAKVVPVFKKGDPTLFENFRPISLLPTISKIFEQLLHNQICLYLESNQLLSQNQFGYRKGHSTDLACATITEQVVKKLDRGINTVAIFMDLSKAFDTIDHTILLKKLEISFGFSSTSIKLVQSYLTNRVQFVNIRGVQSKTRKIIMGVPQGSILGPLFFLMYINDISNVSDLFDSILYADDTTLTFSPNFPHDANRSSHTINTELHKVNNWFRANKLSLNVSKTNFMIFRPQRAVPLHLYLEINGVQIKRVKTFKFLGLTLNETLTWNDHIQLTSVKISRAIGVMGRLRSFLPRSILLTIYHSLIACHFNYNLLVWGHDVGQVFNLQKKAIRIINGSHYLTHTTPIFKALKILKLSDLFDLQLLKFYYRFKNNLLPKNLQDLPIRENSFFHSYNTRNRQKLSIPVYKHAFFRKSLSYSLIPFINKLDLDIKGKINSHSLENIVHRFKELTISSYNFDCLDRNCYSCRTPKDN